MEGRPAMKVFEERISRDQNLLLLVHALIAGFVTAGFGHAAIAEMLWRGGFPETRLLAGAAGSTLGMVAAVTLAILCATRHRNPYTGTRMRVGIALVLTVEAVLFILSGFILDGGRIASFILRSSVALNLGLIGFQQRIPDWLVRQVPS